MQSLSSIQLIIVTDHDYFDKHSRIDCLYLHRSEAIDDLQTIAIGMIGWMFPFWIAPQETWSSSVDEMVYWRNYKLHSAANLPDSLTISHLIWMFHYLAFLYYMVGFKKIVIVCFFLVFSNSQWMFFSQTRPHSHGFSLQCLYLVFGTRSCYIYNKPNRC